LLVNRLLSRQKNGFDPQLRLGGLQYTMYDKFDGRSNYGGAGRNANNYTSLMLFAWNLF